MPGLKIFCFKLILMFCGLLCCADLGMASNEKIKKKPLLYSSYASVLRQYVNDRGLVHYAELAANSKALDQFLDQINQVPKAVYQQWPVDEQVAFWINTYNAMVIKIIAQHYPLQSQGLHALFYPDNSISQIPGVWKEIRFPVMGTPLSLDTIQHDILRKKFNEPRMHMALVNASLGAPRLRNEPYTGSLLHEQLNEQVRRFIKDQSKFGLDFKARRIYLSLSLKWHGEDFTGKYQAQDKFKKYSRAHQSILICLSKHLGEETIRRLEKEKYSVVYLKYNWTLNQADQRK